jgi:hypothetical protein
MTIFDSERIYAFRLIPCLSLLESRNPMQTQKNVKEVNPLFFCYLYNNLFLIISVFFIQHSITPKSLNINEEPK